METAVKRGPGRPAGARNKDTTNRTKAFRNVFTEEAVNNIAHIALARITNSEMSDKEFFSSLAILSKYIIHTVDAELESDTLQAITSPEEATALRNALKLKLSKGE